MNPQEDIHDNLLAKKWNYHVPNFNSVYQINNFDNNRKYIIYPNRWCIYGHWDGNVAVINEQNRDIKIESISFWKLAKKF
tara:strand:+ start:257 stop:496 length:240 start_codon:yes stop_codon:yes gene_type:complete